MKDCIIIGSGVAGISAALTLKANGKSFMLFGTSALSEKIEKAEKIANYPGLLACSGQAFSEFLKKQLEETGITVREDRITGVYALKNAFSVLTERGETYESRTVILACGVESIRAIDGEERLLGRGVSYCATCDGFLYKNKTIAVIATTKRLEHEVEFLSRFAKKIYWIPLYKNPAERKDVEKIVELPKKIDGAERVEKLIFKDRELSVDGVFMLRDCVLPSSLVGGLHTENGHIVVSRNMETNIKGCFAAGDCTGTPYQYAKAAGEGNVAAHSASRYIAEKK